MSALMPETRPAVSLAPRPLYEEVAELLRQRIFQRALEDALAQQLGHFLVQRAGGQRDGGAGFRHQGGHAGLRALGSENWRDCKLQSMF